MPGILLTGGGADRVAIIYAEQRARVALHLMRDAGFDETAAPVAWWALPRSESEPRDDGPPRIAAYLYEQIAEHQAAEAGGLVGKRR